MPTSPLMVGRLAVWHHVPNANAKARVLLFHGISEHSGRHKPTIDWFLSQNIEVVRFDFRGSGQSGGKPQWIEKFSDYVNDGAEILSWIQRSLEIKPLFLFGHSMGGVIAIHFISLYQSQFKGLLLSAPAYKTGSYLPAWKVFLGKALVPLFPGMRLYSDVKGATLSRIPEVEKRYAEDPLSFHFNTLRQGDEILKAMEQVPQVCKNINLPTVIFHGTADKVISPPGSFEILENLSTPDRELHYLPGAFHEPHNDLGASDYFDLVGQWLTRQLASQTTTTTKKNYSARQGISLTPSN